MLRYLVIKKNSKLSNLVRRQIRELKNCEVVKRRLRYKAKGNRKEKVVTNIFW